MYNQTLFMLQFIAVNLQSCVFQVYFCTKLQIVAGQAKVDLILSHSNKLSGAAWQEHL